VQVAQVGVGGGDGLAQLDAVSGVAGDVGTLQVGEHINPLLVAEVAPGAQMPAPEALPVFLQAGRTPVALLQALPALQLGNQPLGQVGGAVAGALIGTGVGIAQGMSAAAVTAASVTGAGAATTALNLTGGNPTDEIQAGSQAIGNLGQAANLAIQQGSQAINTGTNSVYSLVENGATRYFGITGNMGRRTAEHLSQRGWTVYPIDGLQNLSRFDARATEQVLIERYGLPNLYNHINSIAAKNPIYTQAIQRGKEILDIVGIK